MTIRSRLALGTNGSDLLVAMYVAVAVKPSFFEEKDPPGRYVRGTRRDLHYVRVQQSSVLSVETRAYDTGRSTIFGHGTPPHQLLRN